MELHTMQKKSVLVRFLSLLFLHNDVTLDRDIFD